LDLDKILKYDGLDLHLKNKKKSEDFETVQEQLTTCSISTECFKAVVAGLWPLGLFIVARGQK